MKSRHISNIKTLIIFYGWAMSKKLPVNGFRWLDSVENK